MPNEPILRKLATPSPVFSGNIKGAGFHERCELGRTARAEAFRILLDTHLKEMRLAAGEYLSQIHWDQIERMAAELKRRMLQADSELVAELLLEEFFAWKARAGRILNTDYHFG